MKMFFLLFLSLLFYTATASPYQTVIAGLNENITNINYRLPNTTVPIKQSIILNITEDSLKGGETIFYGITDISFKIIQPTSSLYLTSSVELQRVTISDEEGNKLLTSKYEINDLTKVVMIGLKVVMFPGNYIAHIEFSSFLTTGGFEGINRIPYNFNGTKEYLVLTQFQATDARAAFPGFDEPEYKTTFELTLIHPANYNALSNTPVRKIIELNGTKSTTFKETPKMSSYLLAFSLSKFNCSVSSTTNNTVRYSVCSRHEFVDDRSLALEYGVKFLNTLSDWTNYSYSKGNSKMDQIAFPGTYGLAMENWGLITYSETFVLWSSTETPSDWKQYILETIAHETAHQWFGNLVTTKWWDSIFLNEGFATYFSYHLFSLIPELKHFEMEKQFIVLEQQSALEDDDLNSDALLSDVETLEEIEEKFDTISYGKGSSIIKMISHVIGDDNFQKGIQLYVKKHAFKSVVPTDLWEALSPLVENKTFPSNVTLSKFVDSWINEPAYPVVKVVAEADNVILSQKPSSGDEESNTTNTKWYIPIVYKTSSNVTGSAWIEPQSSTTLKNVKPHMGWVIINHNCTGYFRVQYDDKLFNRLIIVLTTKPSLINELDKAQLVDDSFYLAFSGDIKYSDLFRLLKFLKNETSFYPWYAAIRGFDNLKRKIDSNTEVLKNLNSLISVLIENVARNILSINWKTSDHITSVRLPMLWRTACKIGHKKCIDTAIKLFHQSDQDKIHPNVRSIVYCTNLMYSNDTDKDWKFLWKKLQTTEQMHKKQDIINSLACTLNKDHLNFYLQQSLDLKSGLTPLDFNTIWNAVIYASPQGVEVAFDYFINHYSEISEYYEEYSSIFSVITDNLNKQSQLDQLEEFITQLRSVYNIPKLREAAELGLSSAKKRLKLNLKTINELKSYFKSTDPLVISH